ncbi:MAG: hypothetical protein R3A78_13165 [Polyangiales bacterium]
MATAWVLNLDAEDELRTRGPYTPSADLRALVEAHADGAARAVFEPGDVRVDARTAGSVAGLPGNAWCPTPSALGALRAAGARVPDAPSIDVLRAVNDRAFSAALGQTLDGSMFVRAQTDALVACDGGRWLFKRAFSHAGRGRRRVRGEPTPADCAWIAASLREGHGLQVEPWVEVTDEFAVHGVIEPGGAWRLRGLVAQRVAPTGAWVGARPVDGGDLVADERAALVGEGERVAAALAAAGYFGPFGVDAFRYRDGVHTRFQPRSEINARYTMGWAASG